MMHQAITVGIGTRYRCRLCRADIVGPPAVLSEGETLRSVLEKMTGLGDEVGHPSGQGHRPPSPTIIHICWPTQAGIADFAGIEIV